MLSEAVEERKSMKYGYSKVFDPPRVTALYTTDLKEAKRVGNELVKERGFTPHPGNPVLIAPHYGRPVGESWYEIRSEEYYYLEGYGEWEPHVKIYITDPKHYDAEEGGDLEKPLTING